MTTDDRILELLRSAGGSISGPEIGEQLGISRAAVWKHVEGLGRAGYAIERAPSGYRFERAPDRLYPAEVRAHLRTSRIGRVIHHFDSIESTNLHAMDLARAGAPEGEVVVAESQTRGRGRLGRSFFSPHAVSFYGSMILRPEIPPGRAPQITLVAGLAVAETVERHAGIRPGLKWPNDVHLDGLKAAGILTELESEADRVLWVVCGPGVNLNVPADDFPEDLRTIATSVLATTGRRVDRARFAADLFAAFEVAYETFVTKGFTDLRERWESYSVLTGKAVRVDGAEQAAGTVTGIDAEGRLRIRDETGVESTIIAGDVTIAKK